MEQQNQKRSFTLSLGATAIDFPWWSFVLVTIKNDATACYRDGCVGLIGCLLTIVVHQEDSVVELGGGCTEESNKESLKPLRVGATRQCSEELDVSACSCFVDTPRNQFFPDRFGIRSCSCIVKIVWNRVIVVELWLKT